MCIVGVAKTGTTLVIINLHTLTINQMMKFLGTNQAYGTVGVTNANEIFKKSK